MFSHVLVAWDGSPTSQRALGYAVEIARRFGARLQLVSVARSAEHAETDAERKESLEDARRFFADRSGAAINRVRSQGVSIEALVVEGPHPAEAIVDMAHDVGADLIVVGRRGLSGFTRFLMGSIADRIARYAKCPVLIIDER